MQLKTFLLITCLLLAACGDASSSGSLPDGFPLGNGFKIKDSISVANLQDCIRQSKDQAQQLKNVVSVKDLGGPKRMNLIQVERKSANELYYFCYAPTMNPPMLYILEKEA
jgi:hypothetical protein